MRQTAGQTREEFYRSVVRSFADSEMARMSVDELKVHVIVAGLKDSVTKEKVFEKESVEAASLFKLLQHLDANTKKLETPRICTVATVLVAVLVVEALEVLEVLAIAVLGGRNPAKHDAIRGTRTASHRPISSLVRTAVWTAGSACTPPASVPLVDVPATTVARWATSALSANLLWPLLLIVRLGLLCLLDLLHVLMASCALYVGWTIS